MLDQHEEEQVELLKAWWKQNGNLVMGVVTAALIAYAGYQGWRIYQNNQSQEAGVMYGQLIQALDAKDNKKVKDLAAGIVDKYGRSAFGPRAALITAKINYDAGDLKSAKAQLQWVIDNAKESALADMAKMRLAGVLLDEKQYDAALRLLSEKHEDTFESLFQELRGDIFAAQGKRDDAVKAYKQAIDLVEKSGSKEREAQRLRLVEMKRDVLEGAK